MKGRDPILRKTKKVFSSFGFWFYFLVLLNAFPVLYFHYYPTLDGPAHLYNSNLLKQILFNDNQLIDSFFILNPELVPNWTGSGLLLLLASILPVTLAEKVLQLLLVTGIPIAFYYLIIKINRKNQLLSVFIFPFSYSYLFCLGFYNFCLGILVFLIALNVYLRFMDKISISNTLVLLLLIILLFFTHIFVFALAIISLFGYALLKNLGDFLTKRLMIRRTVYQISILVGAFLPGLILGYRFFLVPDAQSSRIRLPLGELLKWLIDIRVAGNFNYGIESSFLHVISLLLLFFSGVSAIRFFRKRRVSDNASGIFQSTNYIWLVISLAILTLYFIFPDQGSSGGSYILMRLNLFFFIFLVFWLSTLEVPSWLNKVSFLLVIVVNMLLLNYQRHFIKKHESMTNEFVMISDYVEDNSIILPVRNSEFWLDIHFSNYLGKSKPQVILENYEATTGFFPLVWNRSEMPMIVLADTVRTDLCLFDKFPDNKPDSMAIDYVLIWGEKPLDECRKEVLMLVSRSYDTVYHSEINNITLFKRPTPGT